jgi:hypothetical protein
MEVLSKHRGGLNALARALLDNEIIDGAEVARLVDEAHGSPVHADGSKSVPHFSGAAVRPPVLPSTNGGNGADAAAGSANGHAGPATNGEVDPVAVRADTDGWPPPPWPPTPGTDPTSGGTPEAPTPR